MKLTEQVISLALAKRLKELGVKQESLFCHREDGLGVVPFEDVRHTREYDDGCFPSAFTVAELGEMLPAYSELFKLPTEQVMYRQVVHDEHCEDGECYTEAATEAEARGLMLAYLIENNLMSV